MNKAGSIQLSGVVITYNEEQNIERCLQSLVGVVDEIVVVDSYSTDRTFELCQQFGVKWIQRSFEGYVEQKNYAASQAKHDYVLSLDADEELSEAMKEAVLHIKSNWTADAYIFNRLNNYCGKWLKYAWYPDAKLRLWDRRKGQWGGENPHDKVVMQEGISPQKVKADILHYPYKKLGEHLGQIQKFSAIAAQAKFNQGKKKSFVLGVILSPLFQFFRLYFLKLGVLDGYYGFLYCCLASCLNFAKYAQLWEMNRQARQEKNKKP